MIIGRILSELQMRDLLYLLSYNIVFIVMNIYGYKEIKRKKIKGKKIKIILFFIFYLFFGIFSKLGSDYYNYKAMVEYNVSKEIFYNFLIKFSKGNIDVFYFYVITLNIIFLYNITKNMKYKLFCLSFFTNFYLLASINILRSIQAQLLVLLGMSFYINKNKIVSHIMLLLSLLFHKSSIINILYWMFKLIRKIKIIYFFIFIFLGIALDRFVKIILPIILTEIKYSIYLIKENNFNFSWMVLNFSGIAIRIVLTLYLLYRYQKNLFFYKKYNSLIRVLIISLLSYISLLFLEGSFHILQRIIIVVFSFHLFLFPKFVEYESLSKKIKITYYLGIILIFILNNISIIRMLYSRGLNNIG